MITLSDWYLYWLEFVFFFPERKKEMIILTDWYISVLVMVLSNVYSATFAVGLFGLA